MPPKTQDLRALRSQVQQETLRIVKDGKYKLGGRAMPLPVKEMEQGVADAYIFGEPEPGALPARTEPTDERPYGPTEVCVLQADTYVAGFEQVEQGFRTAVLNFANQYQPGGGWMHGAGAQEENLHRRSNLFDHLANPRRLPRRREVAYPLPDFGGVFSHSVCVFRGPEADGYEVLPQPQMLSVITAAAYNSPKLASSEEMDSSCTKGTRRKIDAILGVAAREGIQALVLGAFGCGAFRNPPRQMAQLFREQLAGEYRGVFDRVVFAIMDRPDRPDENCSIFREVLHLPGRDKGTGEA